VLQKDGFKTIEAGDRVDALNLLRNGASADLVLSDVRMPKMDGVALAHAIRAEFPAIPVILMSGFCWREEAPELDVTLAEAFHASNSARRDRP
jgi:two-component system cell cycle response regulator CpdR